jgi:hypothetical protein
MSDFLLSSLGFKHLHIIGSIADTKSEGASRLAYLD